MEEFGVVVSAWLNILPAMDSNKQRLKIFFIDKIWRID